MGMGGLILVLKNVIFYLISTLEFTTQVVLLFYIWMFVYLRARNVSFFFCASGSINGAEKFLFLLF